MTNLGGEGGGNRREPTITYSLRPGCFEPVIRFIQKSVVPLVVIEAIAGTLVINKVAQEAANTLGVNDPETALDILGWSAMGNVCCCLVPGAIVAMRAMIGIRNRAISLLE